MCVCVLLCFSVFVRAGLIHKQKRNYSFSSKVCFYFTYTKHFIHLISHEEEMLLFSKSDYIFNTLPALDLTFNEKQKIMIGAKMKGRVNSGSDDLFLTSLFSSQEEYTEINGFLFYFAFNIIQLIDLNHVLEYLLSLLVDEEGCVYVGGLPVGFPGLMMQSTRGLQCCLASFRALLSSATFRLQQLSSSR